eukprot:CAMPEP_0174954610 /NCGR_PEP_ID=MMETSP0004_2-20121128/522_1 /TAXON_ID=420556 /ORGANISM="Ochromonas sp., Strain CCMP1393" /LENGTH=190 /DNA_ID=CAMNT_0016202447 /DNA_START=11 /DNA_END=583 /DNA_ORIENTATION=-
MVFVMDMYKQNVYGAASALSVVIHICAVSTYLWMHIAGVKDVGAFSSKEQGDHDTYLTKCPTEMTELECGYLKSVQVSAVLSIIFGGLTTCFYVYPWFSARLFATAQTFIAVTGSLCQFIFSLMTLVIFMYFKGGYYNDDGVNKEYGGPGESQISYNISFYMWVGGTAICATLAGLGYYELYQHRQMRKA